MVRHLAIRMAPPSESLDDLCEEFEEQLSIGVDEEDLVPRIAAAGHMVDSSGVLNPQRTSHGVSIARSVRDNKT